MLKLTTWGTRGSLPTTSTRCVRYGGATTCLEIELLDANADTPNRIIIDAGTGLAELGRRKFGQIDSALFLQTHLHWDHIQGFPFFGPLFKPGAEFRFLGAARDSTSLEETLREQMRAPYFPVSLDILPSRLVFEDIERQGSMTLGELRLSWDEMHHPSDGCTAWALEYRGFKVVFSGDAELNLGGADALEDLAQNADILVADAQYLEDEYPARVGWGHSTPSQVVELRCRGSCSLTTTQPTTTTPCRLARGYRATRLLTSQPSLSSRIATLSGFSSGTTAIAQNAPGF